MEGNLKSINIDQGVEILLEQIKNFKAFQRGPRQLKSLWNSVNLPEKVLERVFLDQGSPSAWLAITITQAEAAIDNQHFNGKLQWKALINNLYAEPEESRVQLLTELAKRLATSIPEDIQQRVNGLLLSKGLKRPPSPIMVEDREKRPRKCPKSGVN